MKQMLQLDLSTQIKGYSWAIEHYLSSCIPIISIFALHFKL